MKKTKSKLEYEIYNIICPEFCNYILEDKYLSIFINSFEQLKKLAQKQASFLADLLKVNDDNMNKKAYEFANFHAEMKIEFLFLYEALNYLEELIKNSALDIDYLKIKKVFSVLKDISGKVYIKKMIEESLESIIKEENIENYTFIKNFKIYINEEKFLDSIYNFDISEYIGALEFKIKTFGRDGLKIKFEIARNNVQKYSDLFISFFKKRNYKEAVVILDEMIKSSYIMFSILKDIELVWEKEKEKIFASFLLQSLKNQKGCVGIIIEPSVNIRIENFMNGLYFDLKEKLKKFNNIFIFLNNDQIYIYFSTNNKLEFKTLLVTFKKTVKDIANIYKSRYRSILTYPMFRIGLLEGFKFDIDKRTVIKVWDLMKEELEEISSLEAVYFKDFTDNAEELLKKAKYSLSIEEKMIEVIKKNNFTLYAQDIVDINTKGIKAIEILTRLGNIPATEYIEAVKKNNLTLEMDLSVFNKVLVSMELIKKKTDRFFINIFPTSLNSQEFVELVKEVEKKAKEMHMDMIMELTEYTVLKNLDVLNELDVKIAFDDFGSGYTNYERIGKLIHNKNAKILKIDGEIVRNINEPEYMSIIKSISYYAKEEDLEVVYEFVENKIIYDKLKNIVKEFNVKAYAQGFYFSIPVKI